MLPKTLTLVYFLLSIKTLQCANILGVFFFPSISHQIVYRPIWKELSLRGHKVTVITPDPLNDSSLVNLTEIDVHHAYEILKIHRMEQLLSKEINQFQFLVNLYFLMDRVAEAELQDPNVKRLLVDKNQKFDLILTELFHPIMYGLSGKYKAPIIGISSIGMAIVQHDIVGNPTHPILNPDMHLGFLNDELTLWEKIKSVIHSVWYRLYYNYIFMPHVDKMARKYFGNDIPYVGDLERNVSLLFLNVNPFLFTIRPNVPAIIQLGQMHIQPPKPLPDDLQQILDEAKDGVIYFSLGTNLKSVNLPAELLKTIIEALGELQYKVLWKWESDYLEGKPDNVITRKWVPQQDVLAHPNIKAFVMQGGLQSTEEAISRGVPLVGMPFFGDQPMNVQKLVKLGVAIAIDHSTVTKEELKQAIVSVATNKKYKDKIIELKGLVEDQPMTGLERAVWWSEYVIRHKGAKHLRSPMADITWYHYFLVDVFSVIILVPLSIIFVFYKLTKFHCLYKNETVKVKSN